MTWQDVEVHNDAPATRRAFLRGVAGLAVAGAAVAGCDFFGGGGSGPQIEQPQPLLNFLTATIALADRYDATMTAVPALAATLTPIRDAHRAHVKALAAALGTTAPSSPGGPATRPPTDGPSAMAALVAAEKAGRDDAVATCLASVPRYAPLLGSIAAARATHLEVMT
jgi:hypothetical protein